MYNHLCQLASEVKLLLFSKVITGLEKLEVVKTFIVLLFLAQRGRVNLWQEEDVELYITIKEDPTARGTGIGIV